MNKDRCFVCISDNRYAFYKERVLIARVESDDMTKEWIEEYRKDNFKLLYLDITPDAA